MFKKISLVLTLALAVVMLGWSDTAFAAQTAPMHAKPHTVAARHASLPAGALTVIGVNEPMKATGALAAQNQLKISRAYDSRGKVVPGLTGKTIQFSDAGKGKELMQGYSGKRLRISGTLDRASNIFTVNSFRESPVKSMAKAHTRHHASTVAKAEAKHPGSRTMAKADTKSPAKSTTPAAINK